MKAQRQAEVDAEVAELRAKIQKEKEEQAIE
jgi:hypothetical protein